MLFCKAQPASNLSFSEIATANSAAWKIVPPAEKEILKAKAAEINRECAAAAAAAAAVSVTVPVPEPAPEPELEPIAANVLPATEETVVM